MIVSVCLRQCGNYLVEEEYIEPNSVHIALQIPQYFFITAGEVMFSVTGLEFSYSQVNHYAALFRHVTTEHFDHHLCLSLVALRLLIT